MAARTSQQNDCATSASSYFSYLLRIVSCERCSVFKGPRSFDVNPISRRIPLIIDAMATTLLAVYTFPHIPHSPIATETTRAAYMRRQHIRQYHPVLSLKSVLYSRQWSPGISASFSFNSTMNGTLAGHNDTEEA